MRDLVPARFRFVVFAATACMLLMFELSTNSSTYFSSTYASKFLFENDINDTPSVESNLKSVQNTPKLVESTLKSIERSHTSVESAQESLGLLVNDTLSSGSVGNSHGLGSVESDYEPPLDDSLGGLGVSPAEFEVMLCYDPSGRRIELSPPPFGARAMADRPQYPPIFINGGGEEGTKLTSKYEYITRANYHINIISTPVVAMDFCMAVDNIYHNGQHLFSLFSYDQLPGNFEWVGDGQVVDIMYVKTHSEMKFGTIPLYAKVALGGGVDVRMKILSKYNDGPENTAVCFKDARLPLYTEPLFRMTGDDGQCSHANYREIAYKSCGIVAPSAPPKTVTIYQRTKTRKLLDEEKLASTVQTLLGSEWNVNVLVHNQAMPMCDLVRALAGTGVLITPHGFQATNIVFLPYGAQFVEIFPSGYVRDCFQVLASTLDHVGAWSMVSTRPKPDGCKDDSTMFCRGKLRGVNVEVDYEALPGLLKGVASSLEKNGGDEDACLPAWGGWGPRNLGRAAS